MKKLLIVLTLLSFNLYAETVPFIKVVDGDTIETKFASLPIGLQKVYIRISGIDTGETNYLAKCQKEKDSGNLAAARVRQLLIGIKEVEILAPKWDKYGGRFDAGVLVNGINIGNTLLAEGLAKPYYGTGPKPNWCN
jgi:endonuclease YncB( thermonuclease family)